MMTRLMPSSKRSRKRLVPTHQKKLRKKRNKI
jgi:hypothetical protein